MDTQGLLAPPSEQVLGAGVPEGDDSLRIQRDDSMIGKTLDDEAKNVLGEVSGRSLVPAQPRHGPIGMPRPMNCRGPTRSRAFASCDTPFELTRPPPHTRLDRMEVPVHRRLRILLVEDHETVRQGLKLLIDREPDLEVVGEASDGAQAIERGAFSELDVVVMDISMPGISGVIATRKLKELRPESSDCELDPTR